MRGLSYLILISVLLGGFSPAQGETIGWQEAVGRLAGERTRAETCARLLKRHGDQAAVSQGELAYGEAKAEIDAVIAGLAVSLAENAQPRSLPDLEAWLERGLKRREAFCEQVLALMPDPTGQKNLIGDLLGEVLGPLIEAVQVIYLDHREEDRLTRRTIQTQLEATSWPDFASIVP